MWFFGPLYKTILLTREACLFLARKDEWVSLPFPQGVMEHLEVRNANAYAQFFDQAFQAWDLKKATLKIGLTEPVLFTVLLNPQDTDLAGQTKAFIETIPLELESISWVSWQKDNNPMVVATNRELVDPLIRAAQAYHNRVASIHVLPAESVEALTTTPALLASQLSSKQNILELKPLVVTPTPKTETQLETPTKPKTNPWLVGLGLVLVIGLVGAIVWQSKQNQNRPRRPNPSSTPSLVSLPSASASASPSLSPEVTASPANSSSSLVGDSDLKSTLVIEVLNGSGKVGQAKEIETLLLQKGYTNITIDNSNLQETTEVYFSQRVTPSFHTEILELLKTKVTSIDTLDDAPVPEVDIYIVTGSDS